MPEQTGKTRWVTCSSCGFNSTAHVILYEKRVGHLEEPGGPVMYETIDRLVECQGCRSARYMRCKWEPDFHGQRREIWDDGEYEIVVYPDEERNEPLREPAVPIDEVSQSTGERLVPEGVTRMYKETLAALNAKILTLTAGGLRATVEAICLDQGITTRNLQDKIDELAKRDLLTAAQADLLHEERYLGNAALHELSTPNEETIEDGLGIVEGLINTIYILPEKAKRMREWRQKDA